MTYTKPTAEELRLFREERIAQLKNEIEVTKKYLADATANWEKEHLTRQIANMESLIDEIIALGDKPIVWD